MRLKEYITITGRRIPLADLSKPEIFFLRQVAEVYYSNQDWAFFVAWWNDKFNSSGIAIESAVYCICQDMESRLGIEQGKVARPDYRDFISELIDEKFGSLQTFFYIKGIDPEELSNLLIGRGSLHTLHKVLDALQARLVVTTEQAGLSVGDAQRQIDGFLKD